MPVPITQAIGLLPAAPNPATDTPTEFSNKAAAFVAAQQLMPPEINTWSAQANALAVEVDSRAEDAEDAADLAVPAAETAVAAKDISVSLKPTQSPTPPLSPIAGSQWTDSDTGRHYLWYVDANGGHWVEQGGFVVDNATAVTELASDLASDGASISGCVARGVGAIARKIQDKLNESVSVFDFMTDAQIADVEARTYLLDVTDAVKAAIAAASRLIFVDGGYRISDELNLNSNQEVTLSSGVMIRQFGVNKSIFKAVQKDNLWIACNGAVLYGEGSWSGSWTGNSGHEDKAISFIGCTRSGAKDPVIKNCASAGISIVGGRGITLDSPFIEGTHAYSTALPAQANFQNGIYISDSATYGTADDIIIKGADISGTAQGILRENQGSASLLNVSLQIIGPNIHDIPGQHAFYIQGGKTTVSNPSLSNINLAGFKVQSADANQNIRGFTCTGASASTIGSNMFEIACIGTGSVTGVLLSGTGDTVGVGLSTLGKVQNLKADLLLTNTTTNALLMQGASPSDIDVTINGQTIGQDGVLITATNATGIKIRPTLRDCNNSNTGGGAISGIRVQSASSNVEIYHPVITDANTRMNYGLFNAVLGSIVKVYGSIEVSGAASTAVRATGAISEWPAIATLSGAAGKFTGVSMINSSLPFMVELTTASSTNAALWYLSELTDESAILVRVELVGKLAGSAQRRAAVLSGLFYRDGGVATLQGAVDVDVDIASASFTGAYALQVDGANGVVLVVNSGGTNTYNWVARVTTTKVL